MNTFDEMPDYSRVWIYQSDRILSEDEVETFQKSANEFLDQWTAHGKMMRAYMEVKYHRFIIVLADEHQAVASGCSIDKSVSFIKKMEGNMGISFLNRLLIAYKNPTGTEVFPFSELNERLLKKELNEDTIIFNNLVNTKAELQSQWEIPLKNSWMIKQILAK